MLFQAGQRVRAKTGGPDMVIKVPVRRDGSSEIEGYRCEWVVDGRHEEGFFRPDEIQPV